MSWQAPTTILVATDHQSTVDRRLHYSPAISETISVSRTIDGQAFPPQNPYRWPHCKQSKLHSACFFSRGYVSDSFTAEPSQRLPLLLFLLALSELLAYSTHINILIFRCADTDICGISSNDVAPTLKFKVICKTIE